MSCRLRCRAASVAISGSSASRTAMASATVVGILRTVGALRQAKEAADGKDVFVIPTSSTAS
ncbi:hypothetical protein ACQEVF_14665 [Nonomuraea polychroma]|uniref:hypothetical protein n=1 Tax=Nonomuraea polychroma TaxID=46176 RepID=UPI003D8FA8F3